VTTTVAGGPLVVLGAGPAGLGAAYRAALAGRAVVVLEREPRVGGAAGSFEVAGLRVDHGSHRLHHATDPAILGELEHLLGDDLQVRPRRGRIRLAGRWIGFPLTPAGIATSLPPGFAAHAALDTVTGVARRPTRDTFEEVVRAGLGPTMTERFYAPYAAKLWGLPADQLAGAQARARVGASSPGRLLRRVLQGTDPARRTFRYPRRGFGQLWEALAEAATAAGAELRLGTTVTGVAPGRVDTDCGPVSAGTVLSTVPLPLLARLWHGAPPEVTAAAGRLETRAMVLVYLELATPRYTRYDAHYLPEAWTPVTRVSEPKNYRDNPEDPPDRTVLCAELPCTRGDAWWDADDAALGELVATTLQRAGLPAAEVRSVTTRRLPHAYPVYRVGYERHLGVLDEWAGSRERLLTFGRQGLFVHDNSHHALAMAWAAVDALDDDGRVDPAAWRAARARFATHVVED
jgi:protoporphyrinogen oxidase